MARSGVASAVEGFMVAAIMEDLKENAWVCFQTPIVSLRLPLSFPFLAIFARLSFRSCFSNFLFPFANGAFGRLLSSRERR